MKAAAAHTESVGIVSRFFFLALIDETKAFEAATRTWHLIRSRLEHSPAANQDPGALLVTALVKHWHSLSHHVRSGQPVVFADQEWVLPKSLNLGPWLEFRRLSEPDVFFAVLTIKILGLPIADVAKAVGVSEGTLRHRLARGLRFLGSILQPSEGPTL